jgi:hypothetical protein
VGRSVSLIKAPECLIDTGPSHPLHRCYTLQGSKGCNTHVPCGAFAGRLFLHCVCGMSPFELREYDCVLVGQKYAFGF